MTYWLTDRVADLYREALSEGANPTAVIAQTLGVSRSTAGRAVKAARASGDLPPATARTAIGWDGIHEPRQVRWVGHPYEAWRVCAHCRVPWPCPAVTTSPQ